MGPRPEKVTPGTYLRSYKIDLKADALDRYSFLGGRSLYLELNLYNFFVFPRAVAILLPASCVPYRLTLLTVKFSPVKILQFARSTLYL
jgi:hypothetical protein